MSAFVEADPSRRDRDASGLLVAEAEIINFLCGPVIITRC